jgi:hypothetical protein
MSAGRGFFDCAHPAERDIAALRMTSQQIAAEERFSTRLNGDAGESPASTRARQTQRQNPPTLSRGKAMRDKGGAANVILVLIPSEAWDRYGPEPRIWNLPFGREDLCQMWTANC